MKITLLIPNYDHGREVAAVLDAPAPHGLPCLVIDDGSGRDTRERLAALAARHRFVQVHRSHIVNLDAMKLLRPYDERRLVIVLTNGEEIVASRAASEVLRKQAR